MSMSPRCGLANICLDIASIISPLLGVMASREKMLRKRFFYNIKLSSIKTESLIGFIYVVNKKMNQRINPS